MNARTVVLWRVASACCVCVCGVWRGVVCGRGPVRTRDVRSGDGTISHAEFVRAMPLLGLDKHTPREIDELFRSFDPSGDGELVRSF